jgi:hypothetical protein
MDFVKAQAKGFLVGIIVMVLWAAFDAISAQIGLPPGATRSYSGTLFAAAAGAGVVFTWRDAT